MYEYITFTNVSPPFVQIETKLQRCKTNGPMHLTLPDLCQSPLWPLLFTFDSKNTLYILCTNS